MKKSKIIIAIAILLEKLNNSAHNFSQILHLRGNTGCLGIGP